MKSDGTNWTSAAFTGISGTATQYAVIVGDAANAIASVGPSAITGAVLVSNGSSANPSFTNNPSLNEITMPSIAGAGSATNNTVITYEDGTFVATMYGASTTGTTSYTTQNGYYTRIGELVTIHADIVVTAMTGTGNVTLGGIPFPIANLTNYGPIGDCTCSLTWPASTTQIVVMGIANTSTAIIAAFYSNHGLSDVQMANVAGTIRYTLTYRTDKNS